MDREKKLQQLSERLAYIRDIFAGKHNENVRLLETRVADYRQREAGFDLQEKTEALKTLGELFDFVERKLESDLTPMDKVRIVRHPQRICLRDILENVYDNYTEIGSKDEHSIDPAMVIARAYITRRQGKKVFNQSVMVIGQEKGHGEEFRNGGSVKPFGNAKAQHYMQVAETENIPIHTYVFTPGSYPIENSPGAGQQIARNIYEMASLRVPIVAVISEGGSGGAEAIGLADRRLMLSHGYYSVISPEGAAAIEGRLREGERATPELIEKCAGQMKITAEDNLRMGYVDQVIQEPELGARPYHYEFFRSFRQEILRATDEVVLSVRGIGFFRSIGARFRRKKKSAGEMDYDTIHVRWSLSSGKLDKLVSRRHKKFRKLSRHAAIDASTGASKLRERFFAHWWDWHSHFKYDFLGRRKQSVSYAIEDLDAEVRFVARRLFAPIKKLFGTIPGFSRRKTEEAERRLTELSDWDEQDARGGNWAYVSPKAKEDRAITCPNTDSLGCLDLWAPDLYGEFAGVCPNCGHHFPMEWQWYLYNVFDPGSIREFNSQIEAGNPLGIEGFDLKIEQAKKATGHKAGCMTFEATINGINLVVAMLMGNFRGGTVGAAEGEKFVRAAARARRRRYPFLAYVHGTAGIRIQEGTNGLIQMPRCTMSVRRYIDAGGLYIVMYDTNSYAGPVASFLGCSPYQFGIRSANVGFAGPGVITETTGMILPPHYHNVYKALARGHIQGIWDRREARFNLNQALVTMGGRNLYYR
ncbi:MAG: acetyl-CoA carboxylase carboxyl transferase subunit alpha/beta [Deltaproteobacteria bacterium]|jgi:acetyl-CoA carboxylase carboxyl transferase subunit beta|nr:acetyl-CoA carboxylase carboxyl transferase subunit alpha/beta [Deltaproteobacteria bacterium]